MPLESLVLPYVNARRMYSVNLILTTHHFFLSALFFFFSYFRIGLSLAEVLDIIYNEEVEGAILMVPPVPNVDTNQECGG